MDKNSYIVVAVQENGKYCAYVIKHFNSNNLLSTLEIKGIQSANIVSTKKKAYEICNAWNESYEANETYMFDTPKF